MHETISETILDLLGIGVNKKEKKETPDRDSLTLLHIFSVQYLIHKANSSNYLWLSTSSTHLAGVNTRLLCFLFNFCKTTFS